jgi:hypothetical protein
MWNLEDFKLGVGTSNAQIEENINRRYFLCEQKVDIYKAKAKMEMYRLKKMKGKSSDVKEDLIEIEPTYIPTFIIDGEHEIKFLRKNSIHFPLKDDVVVINIGDSIFNLNDLRKTKNAYEIDFLEMVSHKNVGKLVFDKEGKEFQEKDIPKYKEIDELLLKEILDKNQIIKSSINEIRLVETFKKSLMKPSQDNVRTIEENITINLDIILRAVFTGDIKIMDKIKTMQIDSIDGKTETY